MSALEPDAFTEYSVACPDGAIWPDTTRSLSEARNWHATAYRNCGCEESPHVLVRRDVPDWEPA